MKKLSPIQIKLIRLLNDGLWHSGTSLGEQCNISRTAIWKQVKQLIELGLSITSTQQSGYQLQIPLIPLDINCILDALAQYQFNQSVDVHLFASIPSTNRYLKEQSIHSTIAVCCSEAQTAGRGRFGRHWHSPFGENIYCSIRMPLQCDLSRLSGLGLVVSLAMIEAINKHTDSKDIFVKWPNDLMWNNRKLCGNLIEVIAESNSSSDVVIGIGLNVNSITKEQISDKPWCALRDITQKPMDRNLLLGSIIHYIYQFVTAFIEQGFKPFIPLWDQFDYLKNKTISVTHNKDNLSGIAHGVTPMGQLILIDNENTTHLLSSGDTSLSNVAQTKAL